jgi:hypothetical protein
VVARPERVTVDGAAADSAYDGATRTLTVTTASRPTDAPTTIVVTAPQTSATGTVGGTVPATLSLALGAPAAFGAFTPGLAHDYFASSTATVLSTAGDATLSVADPSASNAGHLANGAFALPQAVQAKSGGSAYAPVGGAPLALKAWSAPTSNEPVTIDFKQSIAANDPLRTGTYAKTLTFTLSTTNP